MQRFTMLDDGFKSYQLEAIEVRVSYMLSWVVGSRVLHGRLATWHQYLRQLNEFREHQDDLRAAAHLHTH